LIGWQRTGPRPTLAGFGMGPAGRGPLWIVVLGVFLLGGCGEPGKGPGEANKECLTWGVSKPEGEDEKTRLKQLNVTHALFKLEHVESWNVMELSGRDLQGVDCIFWPAPLGQAGRTTVKGMEYVQEMLAKKKEEGFTHTCADCTGACKEPTQVMPLQVSANEVTVHKCSGEALKDGEGKDLVCMTPYKISMQKGDDATLCTKYTMDEARKQKDTVQSMLHKRIQNTAKHLQLMAAEKLDKDKALAAAQDTFNAKHRNEDSAMAHAKRLSERSKEEYAEQTLEGFKKIDEMHKRLHDAEREVKAKHAADDTDEAKRFATKQAKYKDLYEKQIVCTAAPGKEDMKTTCEAYGTAQCESNTGAGCQPKTNAKAKKKGEKGKKESTSSSSASVKSKSGKGDAGSSEAATKAGKSKAGSKASSGTQSVSSKLQLLEVLEAEEPIGRVEARRSGPFVTEQDNRRWIVDSAG